jgi:CBS domain-containing protein
MKQQNHMRTVEDFMSTAVITLKETDSISAAELQMKIAEIRHIPVVDERYHVVGIISQRDVLRAAQRGNGKPMPVAEIMTRNVLTTHFTTPAHLAAAMLRTKKIGGLPVVGDGQQLVGIITESDFLSIAEQALQKAELSREQAQEA